jgi:regulator of sirC expression with transglutaminase-like and TPR domain
MAQELIPATRHERQKLFLSVLEARLRKEWETCARQAAEGRKAYPTFYDFHLMEGLALGNLGRGEEAVKALQIFLDHVHDDPDCVPAREMLERLSKKQP